MKEYFWKVYRISRKFVKVLLLLLSLLLVLHIFNIKIWHIEWYHRTFISFQMIHTMMRYRYDARGHMYFSLLRSSP